jgi:hypothetical protein
MSSLYAPASPGNQDGYNTDTTQSAPSPPPDTEVFKIPCKGAKATSGSNFCMASAAFKVEAMRDFVKIAYQEKYIGTETQNILDDFRKTGGVVEKLMSKLYPTGNISGFVITNVVKSYCEKGLNLFAAETSGAGQQCINVGLPQPESGVECNYRLDQTYPVLNNAQPPLRFRPGPDPELKLWSSKTWCNHCWLCGMRVEKNVASGPNATVNTDFQLDCEHILPYVTGSIFLKTARGGTAKKPQEQTLHTRREYGQSHHLCNGRKSQGEFIKFDFTTGKIIPDNEQIDNYIREIVGVDESKNLVVGEPPIKKIFEAYGDGQGGGVPVGGQNFEDNMKKIATDMKSTITLVTQKLCDDSLNLRQDATLPSPDGVSSQSVGPSQRVMGALIFSIILNYIINTCITSPTGLTIMQTLKGEDGQGTKNMFTAKVADRQARKPQIDFMLKNLREYFRVQQDIVVEDLISESQKNPLAKEIHARHLVNKIMSTSSFGASSRPAPRDAARSFARGGLEGREKGAMTMQKTARDMKKAQNRPGFVDISAPPPPPGTFELNVVYVTDALIFSKIDVDNSEKIANTFKNIAANPTYLPQIKQVIAELLLKLPAKTYGTNLYHLDVKTLYNNIGVIINGSVSAININPGGYSQVSRMSEAAQAARNIIKYALADQMGSIVVESYTTGYKVNIDLEIKFYAIYIYYFIIKDLEDMASRTSFGKKNKSKSMSIETLKKKLKSVGILITKISRAGKRLPLTRKELEQKASVFTRLQVKAKKKNIRITYKSRDGSRKYKSYKRLVSDLEKSKSKSKSNTKSKSKSKSKFGSTIEGFDPIGRPKKVFSQNLLKLYNDQCKNDPTFARMRDSIRGNLCRNELYCQNLKKTNDQGLIGYKYANGQDRRLRDFMMDDGPGCIPIYNTSANAYNAFHGPTPMMSEELKNTLLNSHTYFNRRNTSENRAIDRIRGIRYNRGLSRHNAPPPIQRQTPARFGA